MTNKQNRRDFLKIIGASSVGIALSSQNIFAQRRKKSCVIIGAGFSGFAAAYKLKNAGWNVTILEARDRIGGRVFSYSFAQNKESRLRTRRGMGRRKPRTIKSLCARIFQFLCKNISLTIIFCKTAKFRVPARGDFPRRQKPLLKK